MGAQLGDRTCGGGSHVCSGAARVGAAGGMADGGAVVLRGRAAERLAMRAETASQAPWRAAIAAAGELKQAICEARRQMRGARNDPIHGTIHGTGGSLTPGVRNDPICGTGGQTRDGRNDPICGSAAPVWAAGAALDTRLGVLAERRAGETALWAPGSRGLREALAREVEKRRLRVEVGMCATTLYAAG